MDLHDDQPGRVEPERVEPGRRLLTVADVEPIDVDGVRTVAVGSAVWLVVLVALLPFTGPLDDMGRTWWLFTALAGAGLGLVGLEYCRRRSAALGTGGHEPAPEPTPSPDQSPTP